MNGQVERTLVCFPEGTFQRVKSQGSKSKRGRKRPSGIEKETCWKVEGSYEQGRQRREKRAEKMESGKGLEGEKGITNINSPIFSLSEQASKKGKKNRS